LQKLSTQFL